MNLELFLLNDKMATSKSSRAGSLDPLDILDFLPIHLNFIWWNRSIELQA